ncbi:hypothetical protein Q7P36_003368 [Cladosporium allicinum]
MSPSGRCSEGQLAWFDEASNPAVCWIGYPVPAVGFPTTVSLLFALSKYRAFQERQRQPRESEKYQQHDRDNLHDSHSLTTELFRIATFLTPFCYSLLVTNYLTTCFGWLHLLGLETEPPSFTGSYYLGCFSFLAVWMVMSLPALSKGDRRRAKRQPWSTFVQELIFDGEAVGWATTLQLAMWLFLKAAAVY